jgi:hypothetical protein
VIEFCFQLLSFLSAFIFFTRFIYSSGPFHFFPFGLKEFSVANAILSHDGLMRGATYVAARIARLCA